MATGDGLVTRAAVRAMGATDREIDWALRCGDVISVRRGVLAPPGLPVTAALRQAAAVVATGEGAVLSHFAAGGRHRFPGIAPGALELTVPRHRAARLEGVVAHAAPDLQHVDTVVVDGVPCTTPARTALDITASVGPNLRRRIIAHIERTQRRDGLVAIRAAADRIGNKRRPAVAPLLDLIDQMLCGAEGLDLTPRCLAAIQAAGIRRPELEVPVTWGGRAFVLDAAFLPEQVDVELDDDWSHATAAGSHADKERDRAARRAGWEVERVTPETDIDAFVEHLGWLLEGRGRRTA
ncbi:MAG: hypothetical protein M3137_10910 [Actinomycetota bacterium]|nr:hypothetical protein [Actinomycetota bacterium]